MPEKIITINQEPVIYKLNLEHATQESIELMLNRRGYRCDDLSEVGSFNLNPKDIFDQEINEFGNDDIMLTMHNLYGTHENFSIDEIDNYIKATLNTDKYYLIWLTSNKKDDIDYTEANNEQDALNHIYSVEFDRSFMPISDLGPEGMLIAYTD